MICLLLLSIIFLTAAATAVISLISVYNPNNENTIDSISSINTKSNEKLSQPQINTFDKDLNDENEEEISNEVC